MKVFLLVSYIDTEVPVTVPNNPDSKMPIPWDSDGKQVKGNMNTY